MAPGKTCTWCDGDGLRLILGGDCGWCDGTGVQKPDYLGCEGCPSEHRTVGPIRAWCFDCREWCYPEDPCVRGRGGAA